MSGEQISSAGDRLALEVVLPACPQADEERRRFAEHPVSKSAQPRLRLDRRPTGAVTVLSACCQDALQARNGCGRRWAVERCVRALQAPGVRPASPAIDKACARAMVAVAEAINACAATSGAVNAG